MNTLKNKKSILEKINKENNVNPKEKDRALYFLSSSDKPFDLDANIKKEKSNIRAEYTIIINIKIYETELEFDLINCGNSIIISKILTIKSILSVKNLLLNFLFNIISIPKIIPTTTETIPNTYSMPEYTSISFFEDIEDSHRNIKPKKNA